MNEQIDFLGTAEEHPYVAMIIGSNPLANAAAAESLWDDMATSLVELDRTNALPWDEELALAVDDIERGFAVALTGVELPNQYIELWKKGARGLFVYDTTAAYRPAPSARNMKRHHQAIALIDDIIAASIAGDKDTADAGHNLLADRFNLRAPRFWVPWFGVDDRKFRNAVYWTDVAMREDVKERLRIREQQRQASAVSV